MLKEIAKKKIVYHATSWTYRSKNQHNSLYYLSQHMHKERTIKKKSKLEQEKG